MMGPRRSLGLALGERRIVAAEVTATRDGPRVLSAADLVFPEGVSWDDPAAVGEHLGRLLRQHRMPRSAVVGLPARWLAAKPHGVPPVDAASLAPLLRLAAEGAFSMDAGRMVCDVASAPPEGTAGTALLVAATRERVAAVSAVARAARIRLRAVTATPAVLALAAPPDATCLVAVAGADGMGVAGAAEGRLTALRHVPLARIDDAAAVAAALRMGMGPLLVGPDGAAQRLVLWDDTGLDEDELTAACARAGIELQDGSSRSPLAGLDCAGVHAGRVGPAAALAAAGLDARLLPFDLSSPRLAIRAPQHYVRWGAWAALVLVAFLAAGGVMLADRRARAADVAALTARLHDMAPSIEAAQDVVDSIGLARGWYDRRPAFLDCLAALTQAFPEYDGRIWATSLAVREDMRGVLSGKATSEELVLALLDELQKAGFFADVKLLYVRETRGAAEEDAFAIDFAQYEQADE